MAANFKQMENVFAVICRRCLRITHRNLLYYMAIYGRVMPLSTSRGRPVIFDPACYYGDREADLAMTELFGGFSRDFYAAYQDAWPLNQSYSVRKTLYNLYHILNHLNLFGGGYLRQAESMMTMLLSEIR